MSSDKLQNVGQLVSVSSPQEYVIIIIINIFVKRHRQSYRGAEQSTVCWGCCQNEQHFFGYSTFTRDSINILHQQSSGNLCDIYIENFPVNQLVKEFCKIDPHLPKLLSNIKGFTFFETQCSFCCPSNQIIYNFTACQLQFRELLAYIM